MSSPRASDTLCHDCNVDTLPTEHGTSAEFYMVHDHLWAEYGADDGYLWASGASKPGLAARYTATTSPLAG